MDSRRMGLDHFLEVRLDAGASSLGDPQLAARIVNALGTIPGRRVLDAGCGAGQLAVRLAEMGALVSGVDVCENLLTRAQRLAGTSCDFAQADACCLPFRDASFDAAVGVLVLHYLERPDLALKELSRVIRGGGSLVLADRIANSDGGLRRRWDRIERLRNASFCRVLTSREIEGLLGGAGFAVLGSEVYVQTVTVDAWLVGVEEDPARTIRDTLANDSEGSIFSGDDRLRLESRIYSCWREGGRE